MINFVAARNYNLRDELNSIFQYYERFWLDTVQPEHFSVYRVHHRTNNFIESYHASLVRMMGIHPRLYDFYSKLNIFITKKKN